MMKKKMQVAMFTVCFAALASLLVACGGTEVSTSQPVIVTLTPTPTITPTKTMSVAEKNAREWVDHHRDIALTSAEYLRLKEEISNADTIYESSIVEIIMLDNGKYGVIDRGLLMRIYVVEDDGELGCYLFNYECHESTMTLNGVHYDAYSFEYSNKFYLYGAWGEIDEKTGEIEIDYEYLDRFTQFIIDQGYHQNNTICEE